MDDAGPIKSPFVKTLGSGGVLMLTFSALSPGLGVYVGGSSMIHLAGSGAAIGLIVGGVFAILMALLYAELAAAFPRAGGFYPAVAHVFGSGAAFPLVMMNTLFLPTSVAFWALGFAEYLHYLLPAIGMIPAAICAIVAAAAIAMLQIRVGALVTGAFLALELGAVLLLSAVAITHPARGLSELIIHPVMPGPSGMVAVPAAILGLVVVSGSWDTAGASWAMQFAEEMRDAKRKIGGLIAWASLGAALLIAGPVLLLMMSAPDLPALLTAEAPIAYFLQTAASPLVAKLVSAGVVIALFNAVIAVVLAYGRSIFATCRDEIWPAPVNRTLGTLHPRLQTPVAATILLAILSMAACFLGQRTLMVLLSGDVITMFLLGGAVFIGRRLGLTGQYYRAPLHPVLPVLVILAGFGFAWATWLDKAAGRPSVILISGVFLAALAYDAWRRRSGTQWRMRALVDDEA